MNNKFGRDPRQRGEFRRDRRAGEPPGRSFDDDRRFRSPDQEFETSGPYRQPREPYGEPPRYQGSSPYESGSSRYESGSSRYESGSSPYESGNSPYESGSSRYDGRSSFDGSYAPSPYASGAEYGGYGGPRWPRESGGWSVTTRGGYAGRGPQGYTRSDERIREDVCDRLSWNDEVDATDIIVRVQSGEVTLEGSVETRRMKRLAEDIAEDVPGVIDVHNTVRVKKPILTEIKEKLTGEAEQGHYANTGTRTTGSGTAPNGTP